MQTRRRNGGKEIGRASLNLIPFSAGVDRGEVGRVELASAKKKN